MANRYSEVIARLEIITGPDPLTDAMIVAARNDAIVKPYPPTDDFGPKDRWQFWSQDGKHFLGSEGKFPVAPVTGSIDAAMKQVPKNWRVNWAGETPSGEWFFELIARDENRITARKVGATAAIALCIVSLIAEESRG